MIIEQKILLHTTIDDDYSFTSFFPSINENFAWLIDWRDSVGIHALENDVKASARIGK